MSKIIRSTCSRSTSSRMCGAAAIQSLHTQETPMVRLCADDGAQGTGCAYTIGTGGWSVVAPIRDHLGAQWNWKAIDRLRVAPPAVPQANASNATKRRVK